MAKQHSNINFPDPLPFEVITDYMQGKLTDEEAAFVEEVIAGDELYKQALEGFEFVGNKHLLNNAISSINSSIENAVENMEDDEDEGGVVVGMGTAWYKYAAVAASIVVFLGIGYIFINNSNTNEQVGMNDEVTTEEEIHNNETTVSENEEIPPVEASENDPKKDPEGNIVNQNGGIEYFDLETDKDGVEDHMDKWAEQPIIVEKEEEAKKPNQQFGMVEDRADANNMQEGKNQAASEPPAPEVLEKKMSDKPALVKSKAKKEVKTEPSKGAPGGGMIAMKPVNGNITDEDGNPLLGVSVYVNGEKKGSTDEAGNFNFVLKQGFYNMSYSYVGYLDKFQRVNISSLDDQKDLDITLKKDALAQDIAAADNNDDDPFAEFKDEISSTFKIELGEEEDAIPEGETEPIGMGWSAAGLTEEEKLQKGMQAYNKGEYAEAAFYLESVISGNPGKFDAQYYAGMSYFNTGAYNKAIKKYNKVIETPANNFYNKALWYKAQSLIKKNDEAGARPLLEKLADNTNEYQGRAKALHRIMYSDSKY